MAQYPADDVRARARAWIDSVNGSSGIAGGWRLEVLRLRSRRRFDASSEPSHSPVAQELSAVPPYPVPSDVPVSTSSGSSGEVVDVNGDPVSSGPVETQGPCPDAPLRIRRFVQGCPWALVPEAIRYLHELAPYEGIVFNGVKLPGRYRPTVTSWNRDEGERVAEGRDVTGTYTLVQDLVEVSDCADDLLASTASSCLADEETRFVWDADSVDMSAIEELTCDVSQGVTVSIRAVSRDEAGLFSYQVVKTRAKSSAAGPYVVACTRNEVVEETVWRNLYGCPGVDLGMDPDGGCAGCSAPSLAGVPPSSCTETERGVRTQWEVRQNQDCTWDVTRRVRRPREDSRVAEWSEGVSCRRTDVRQFTNWAGDMEALVGREYEALAPGERLDANVREDEDGLWSGTVSKVAAEEPYAFDFASSEGPCSRSFERSFRSRTDAPFSVASPGSGFRPAAEALLDQLEEDVRRTYPDWTTSDGAPLPVRRSASVRRNDDCTWDADLRVEPVRKPVRESWTEGSGCRTSDVTAYFGWAERPEVPAPTKSTSVSARLSMSEDCTWSGEVSVTNLPTSAAGTWRDGSGCAVTETTAFSRVAELPEVPEPGPNRRVDASFQMGEDCTWSGRVSVTDLPSAKETWTEGSRCRGVETTAYHRWTSRPEVPEAGAGETVQANFSMADDCTWSGSVSVAKASPDSQVVVDGSESATRTVEMAWSQAELPDLSPRAGVGETVSLSLQRNADCTWDWVKRTDRNLPREATGVADECDSEVETTTYSGQPDGSFAQVVAGPGETVSTSVRQDADGTYSGEVRVVRRKNLDSPPHVTVVSGTASNPVQEEFYWGLSEPVQPELSDGWSTSVSVTRNADCTFDEKIVRTASGGRARHFEIYGPALSEPVVMRCDPYGAYDATCSKMSFVVTLMETGIVSNTATAISGLKGVAAQKGWTMELSSFGSNGATGEGDQVIVADVRCTKAVLVTVEGGTEKELDEAARQEALTTTDHLRL